MIYRFGDCLLDTNLCTLQRGGQTFRLRLKVFRMCLYLLEHRDRVVSREELCAEVWPGQAGGVPEHRASARDSLRRPCDERGCCG